MVPEGSKPSTENSSAIPPGTISTVSTAVSSPVVNIGTPVFNIMEEAVDWNIWSKSLSVELDVSMDADPSHDESRRLAIFLLNQANILAANSYMKWATSTDMHIPLLVTQVRTRWENLKGNFTQSEKVQLWDNLNKSLQSLVHALVISTSKRLPPSPHFEECVSEFFVDLPHAVEENGWLKFKHCFPDQDFDSVFIRECYRIIGSEIKVSRGKVLITGTPGIGKSIFLYYLLWVLVCARHRVIYFHHPTTTYYDGSGRVFSVKQLPDDSDRSFWNRDLFVLFDAYEMFNGDLRRFPYNSCTFILSTFPRRDLVNDFKKSRMSNYYMPPWSEEEMIRLESAYPHVTHWRYRFEYLGGIPRTVFEIRDTSPDRSLEQKITRACYNFDLRNLQRLFWIDPIRYDMSFASDLLFHITSDSTYREPMLQFASRKSLEIFMKIHGETARRDIVGTLLADNDINPLIFGPSV